MPGRWLQQVAPSPRCFEAHGPSWKTTYGSEPVGIPPHKNLARDAGISSLLGPANPRETHDYAPLMD